MRDWEAKRRDDARGPKRVHVIAILLLTLVSTLANADRHALAISGDSGANSATAHRVVLRFLTTDDFPPFNFIDEYGTLTGFNVLLARAICQELDISCDVTVRPWRELFERLNRGEADAVIAGHVITADALRQVDFTHRYFNTPGRFVVRKNRLKLGVDPESLEDRSIGVAQDTTHAAYLKAFYRFSHIVTYPNQELARDALRAGEVDAVFGDAVSLSFWLNGWLSRKCCEFRGGAYVEPKFFGDGLAIAVPRNDPELRHLLNNGLELIRRKGRLSELVERFFPYPIY